jgi:hypothetical protein
LLIGTVRDHAGHLVSESPKTHAHVFYLVLHELLEQRNEVAKSLVVLVAVPSLDEDAVVLLQNEVVGNVVNDDRLFEWSADLGEIFDYKW